ncbi:MAG: hypothetical protein U9Q03_04475 [Patescibacteria group bacterium]|nr:hypothetical protein [Patescibacteria group bacterium]
MTALRIIGGLLIVGVGVFFVIKTEWFMRNIGRIQWAEEKLGDSRLFYKLLGIIIILIGLMLSTNMLGGFLVGTVGKLFVSPSQR